MALARWDQRFRMSTRGRIVTLLRRASRTVDELAQALDLTDNAVRAHIATLERDGLVEQRGMRRGTSKPAQAYDLTLQAEQLFPKAYAPVLGELLTVLADQYGMDTVELLLRTAGRRLARDTNGATSSLDTRLAAAVDILNGLGGLAEYSLEGTRVTIQGFSCPLTAVAVDHPEVCRLAETLVSAIVDMPMHEACDRHDRPRCAFIGNTMKA